VRYTLTGKKLEIPVRKLLLGWPADRATSRDAMKNHASLDFISCLRTDNKGL
jgi:acetoacetyl-CoA synthetase